MAIGHRHGGDPTMVSVSSFTMVIGYHDNPAEFLC